MINPIEERCYKHGQVQAQAESVTETRYSFQKIKRAENKSCLEEFQHKALRQCSRDEQRLLQEFPGTSYQMHAVQYKQIIRSVERL